MRFILLSIIKHCPHTKARYISTIQNSGSIMAHVTKNEVANDYYVPSAAWPNEAVELYNKFKYETTINSEWEKYCRASQEDLDDRHFIRASGEKMFFGAFFINKTEKIAKGVTIFGPWTQGGTGFVHGGAIASIHDSITGVLVNNAIGPAVTGNLNTNFRRGIPLGTSTLVTAMIEEVAGRRINLKSKIMSPDESVLYGDATALYILLNKQ